MTGGLPGRSAVVDLLRGTAIGLVLLLHFSLTYHLADSPLASLIGPATVRRLVNNGNFGVTVFFVISGFLITRNVLARDGRLTAIDWRRFLLFRAARILPMLLLALTIVVGLGLAGRPSFVNKLGGDTLPASFFVLAAGSVLSFTHNLLMQSFGYFNYALNVYWSLSVEEVFYLGFAGLCLLAGRDALIAAVALALILIGPLYRSVHADDEILFMYANAACFDAIAFGVLAALLARSVVSLRGWAGPLAIAASACLVAAYWQGIGGHEAVGFTQVAGATAALLFATSAGAGERVAAAPVFALLRWAGRHSYELYLLHIVVLGVMRDALPRNQLGYAAKLPWLLVFLVASALVAGAAARWFAEPANRALRRRFGRGKTSSAAVQPRVNTIAAPDPAG